jgi:hypothetical protein
MPVVAHQPDKSLGFSPLLPKRSLINGKSSSNASKMHGTYQSSVKNVKINNKAQADSKHMNKKSALSLKKVQAPLTPM